MNIRLNSKNSCIVFVLFFTELVLLTEPCFTADHEKVIKELEIREKESSEQADKIRVEIEKWKEKKDELAKEELSISDQLKKISSELKTTESKMRSLQNDMGSVRKRIESTRNDLKIHQEEANRWNKIAVREMNYLYRNALHKDQENMMLANMLSAKNFGDYIRNQKYMKSIISQKTAVFQKTKSQIEKTKKLEQDLELKNEKLLRLTKKEQQTKRSYQVKKEKQRSLLKEVQEQKKKAEAEIKELENNANILQEMVDKFRKQREEAMAAMEKEILSAGLTAGKVTWPVKGNVISFFGNEKHPQLADTYINNRGIKINVPEDIGVAAVEKGIVLFVNEFKSYGNMIIVDHGNGYYTIYGLLSKFMVKESDKVDKGQVIAKADRTVYFEIRVDGRPEDPLKWLVPAE